MCNNGHFLKGSHAICENGKYLWEKQSIRKKSGISSLLWKHVLQLGSHLETSQTHLFWVATCLLDEVSRVSFDQLLHALRQETSITSILWHLYFNSKTVKKLWKNSGVLFLKVWGPCFYCDVITDDIKRCGDASVSPGTDSCLCYAYSPPIVR